MLAIAAVGSGITAGVDPAGVGAAATGSSIINRPIPDPVAGFPPPAARPARSMVVAAQADVAVAIADFVYDPPDLTVVPGTTLVWTNADATPHTVTGGFGDSNTMAEGAIYRHTFNAPGVFPYICQFHPNMAASVTVVPAAVAADSPIATGSPPGNRADRSDLATVLTLMIALLVAIRELLP